MTFSSCKSIDATGSTITNSTIKVVPAENDTLTTNSSTVISGSTINVTGVTAGNRWASVASPVIFASNTFTGSSTTGHAIRITSTTGSPFAFTGNKFEFRAVGSSASVAFPVTLLNAAVTDGISEVLFLLKTKMASGLNQDAAILATLREVAVETKAIRFEGNNYSEDWIKEAEKQAKISIVLRKIAKDRRLNATQEEVEEMANQVIQAAIMRGEVGQNDVDPVQIKENVTSRIINEKTLNYIESQCAV